jgi:hypothetical protein
MLFNNNKAAKVPTWKAVDVDNESDKGMNEEEKDAEYDWYQEDNQIETVTPFTIVNQTNCKMKIIQGGILDEATDVRVSNAPGRNFNNTSMRLLQDQSFTSNKFNR